MIIVITTVIRVTYTYGQYHLACGRISVKNGTHFAYNKNNMKNVVDGKIEIDCLIRGIANGFSSFLPRRRDYDDRGIAHV